MTFESMRSAIIYVGWPILILGSFLFIMEAYRFYKKTNKLALGKLILTQTISILIGMYSLGIVSTIYMFCNLETGVKVVMPIFMVWFLVMAALYYISRRWRNEAANINILYYKIKERTEKLKQEKTKLSSIAEHMTTGAILLDTGGKPMFINREAKAIVGSKSDDDSKLIKLLYKKFAKYRLENRVKKCLNGEPSNILDVKINNKIYEVYLRSLVGHGRQSKDYFGHFIWIHDVTEEKMLIQAERRFLTVASHKLRTPLTGIKGFIDMVLRDSAKSLDKTQKEYLDEAKKCTSIMSDVVNQLLYASEADIKKMKINLEKTAVDKVLEKVISEVKTQLGKKMGKIVITKQKDTDFVIQTDINLLHRAIETLVQNAVIYSQSAEGSKMSEVNIELKKDDVGNLIIIVNDSGIGIPKEEQERIFTKFYRAGNAMRVHTEGIGLNLSLARQIVESLGGKLSLESKVNKGSAFTIILPIKASRQKLHTT